MGKESNTCAHCGADNGKHPVIWQDHAFCCNGCKTVYQLLNENKLYNYYNLENTPGIKVETTEFGNKYAFLDTDEMKEKLILFHEGGISKVRFYIPVIHCASCIWLLENLRTLHPGIRYSSVHFSRKEVDITFEDARITLRQVVELLASIHYIPDLSLKVTDRDQEKSSDRKLLIKIGVAGFAFINVMTYSLPAYFNGRPLSDNLQDLFNILSYILILPVVFYSASDYYISAFKNGLKKNISIDLPIAIGIVVLFLVSTYEIFFSGGTGYCDSLSGLIFFLLVGKWYQGKTYKALSFDRNYKSYFPIAVTRINKQIEESTLIEHLKEGDELLIRNKELIPADAILVEGDAHIDYSFVTGESNPMVKKPGEIIYAGGRQVGGIIRVQVKKEVSQSNLTRLWDQDRTYEKPSDSLKTLSDTISKYFTLVIITIALGGFVYWLINGDDLETALYVFTAVLIVACPCALALSIPFTFGNTMRIFGKKGLYIKNTGVIERLSKVDTIVFDKTGTITVPNESEVEYNGSGLTDQEKSAVYSIARQSTHPLSLALSTSMEECTYQKPKHVVEVAGRGLFGKVGDTEIRLGSAEYVPGETGSNTASFSTIYIAVNGINKGYFSIGNRYRDGFEDILKSLSPKHEIYLISGDNEAERDRLSKYFKEENLRFNQSPDDKADFIKKLQHEGRTVLMTGDGLNDAGALLQSDVALTIADKAYHFSPASDAVLEAIKFPMLAGFIRFTGISLRIVKISFLISFLYNIVGISFAITGSLSPVIAAILMPISSVSVVAFATFVTRMAGKWRI